MPLEAVILGSIAALIFGGGYFIVALIVFWVRTVVDNHAIRMRNRRILANQSCRFIEHY